MRRRSPHSSHVSLGPRPLLPQRKLRKNKSDPCESLLITTYDACTLSVIRGEIPGNLPVASPVPVWRGAPPPRATDIHRAHPEGRIERVIVKPKFRLEDF